MCIRASGAPQVLQTPCAGFAPAALEVAHPPGLGCRPPPPPHRNLPVQGWRYARMRDFPQFWQLAVRFGGWTMPPVLAFFLHRARPRPVPWTHHGLIPRSVSLLWIIRVEMDCLWHWLAIPWGEGWEGGGNGRWQVTAIRVTGQASPPPHFDKLGYGSGRRCSNLHAEPGLLPRTITA